MDGEKKSGRDGCWEELFGPRADSSFSDGEALDDSSRVFEDILSQETVNRGRPKALCYEHIMLMVVRRKLARTSIKLMHHKGIDTVGDPRSF